MRLRRGGESDHGSQAGEQEPTGDALEQSVSQQFLTALLRWRQCGRRFQLKNEKTFSVGRIIGRVLRVSKIFVSKLYTQLAGVLRGLPPLHER